MINNKAPRQDNSRYAGLIAMLLIYFVLSAFSVAELVDFSKVMESETMRIKLLLIFGLTVVLPVYLGFVKSCDDKPRLKLSIELSSVLIIVVFYFASVKEFCASRSQCCEIFVILASDIISSILLYVFHKEKELIDQKSSDTHESEEEAH